MPLVYSAIAYILILFIVLISVLISVLIRVVECGDLIGKVITVKILNKYGSKYTGIGKGIIIN